MINEYIKNKQYRKALGLPETVSEEYYPLAQGEYNVNYDFIHPVTGEHFVLRVNCGSQMHLTHQIEYEANVLKLLENSGRTPRVVYVDGSDTAPGKGVIVEEFIPGHSIDYKDEKHMLGVAECLADIHSVRIGESEHIDGMPGKLDVFPPCLISPDKSLSAILDECEEMVKTYMNSDLGCEETKTRLRDLLDNAWILAERGDHERPYSCCINTELNSSNFLVHDDVKLIDWEKPLYGDPAQDLGHFLAPTTTFWKTDVILEQSEIDDFLDKYIDAVGDRYDTTGLRERTLACIPVTCLRGMTWCAMAWVEYQQADKKLINADTMLKLEQYLDDTFITMIESLVERAL